MALLPIITAPDPRLKVKSTPVDRVDDDLRRLMEDMLETMYAEPGVGLAAIQVGVAKRVIVIDVSRDDEPKAPQYFINPEIIWSSDDLVPYEEGCLSLPDMFAEVERPSNVRVRHLDRQGKVQETVCEGILAVCIQHEMDHLEGVLFVDHISALKRNIIMRKLTKIKKLSGKDDAKEDAKARKKAEARNEPASTEPA